MPASDDSSIFFFLSGLDYLKSVPRKNLSLSRDFFKPIINLHGSFHQCNEFALLFHYEGERNRIRPLAALATPNST